MIEEDNHCLGKQIDRERPVHFIAFVKMEQPNLEPDPLQQHRDSRPDKDVGNDSDALDVPSYVKIKKEIAIRTIHDIAHEIDELI